MIFRKVDKRNTSPVREFRLGFEVNDPTFGADSAAIDHHSEIVGLACQEHATGLDLHSPQTEVSCLPNSELVKADKGDGAVNLKTRMSAFLSRLLSHMRLRIETDGVKGG